MSEEEKKPADAPPEDDKGPEPTTPLVSPEELASIRSTTRPKKTEIARRGDAKAEIAAYLKKIYPQTRTGKELEQELDMLHETVSASLIKLEKAGRIRRLDERRKNATGRFSRCYASLEVVQGRTCSRCSRQLAEWPIKLLDRDHLAIDIAPDDRAFKKVVTDGGKKIARYYCGKCLRVPKVLKRALKGKKIPRVKLAKKAPKAAPAGKPKKTFKEAKS